MPGSRRAPAHLETGRRRRTSKLSFPRPDEIFARVAQAPEWKQALDARMVENVYLNSRATRTLLESEFAEYRMVLTEIGLAGPTPARYGFSVSRNHAAGNARPMLRRHASS